MSDGSASLALDTFLTRSRFAERGGVITDLDGTSVHEFEGRIAIATGVVDALKRLAAEGRPLVLNTMRFPLNVIQTFGHAWYEISSRPVPLVSLNGAVLGDLDLGDGAIVFRERAATPLDSSTIEATLADLDAMLADGLEALLVFHYPRDWREGEIIWSPSATTLDAARGRYLSASDFICGPVTALRARLRATDVLMLFVLVDAPADRLMAYQHARPSAFVTAPGVDKLTGARRAADLLGFDLEESVGAGDTPMDSFLDGVGLGVHVGPIPLAFRARYGEVRLSSSAELGAFLANLRRETS